MPEAVILQAFIDLVRYWKNNIIILGENTRS
jgi:hypothetical protein